MFLSNIEDILDFLEDYYIKGKTDSYDGFKMLLDNDIIKKSRIGEIHDSFQINNIYLRMFFLYYNLLDLPIEHSITIQLDKWLDELCALI